MAIIRSTVHHHRFRLSLLVLLVVCAGTTYAAATGHKSQNHYYEESNSGSRKPTDAAIIFQHREEQQRRRQLQLGSSICTYDDDGGSSFGSGVNFDSGNDFLRHVFINESKNQTICTCQEQGKDEFDMYNVGNITAIGQEAYFAAVSEAIRAFDSNHTYACTNECEHCYVNGTNNDVCGFYSVKESASFKGRPNATFSLTTPNLEALMDIYFDVEICMEYTRGYQGTIICFNETTSFEGEAETSDDIIKSCQVMYNGRPCDSCSSYLDRSKWCLVADCTKHEAGADIDTCKGEGIDGMFLPLQHNGGRLETPNMLVGCVVTPNPTLPPYTLEPTNSPLTEAPVVITDVPVITGVPVTTDAPSMAPVTTGDKQNTADREISRATAPAFVLGGVASGSAVILVVVAVVATIHVAI